MFEYTLAGLPPEYTRAFIVYVPEAVVVRLLLKVKVNVGVVPETPETYVFAGIPVPTIL